MGSIFVRIAYDTIVVEGTRFTGHLDRITLTAKERGRFRDPVYAAHGGLRVIVLAGPN
jgi:hypothetical protein